MSSRLQKIISNAQFRTQLSPKNETINSATFCRDPFEIFFDEKVSKLVSWSAPLNLTEITTGTSRENKHKAAKTRPRNKEHHFCLLWVVSDSSTFGLTMTKKRGECCAPSILKNKTCPKKPKTTQNISEIYSE